MPKHGRAPESPTSPHRLKVRERALQALEMRKAGATFEVIAGQLRYSSKADAYKAVMRFLDKQADEAAEPLRRLEVERCDKLQLAVWADAVGGNLKAIETVLHIMERRARLLGLDLARDEVKVGLIMPPTEIRFVVQSEAPRLEAGQTQAIDAQVREIEIDDGGNGHPRTPNPS